MLTLISPLYSMNPRSLNLFMKKLTRERVVPTISARGSCEVFGPRQPLFTGVEEMIDQVGFDPDVPRQHVRDEPFRESGLVAQKGHASRPSR